MAERKIRDKARKIAAHLLEVAEEDLEWETGKFSVKGAPQKSKTIQEIAFAVYTNHPQGMEAGLEATSYYDPPNLTFPFGSYICVVDIDRGTGMVRSARPSNCSSLATETPNPASMSPATHHRSNTSYTSGTPVGTTVALAACACAVPTQCRAEPCRNIFAD